MLETLITSKTRIKLLLKFFLNPNTSAHLRGLASELDESSNAVRMELNRFEEAGMLQSLSKGNKKLFQVNTGHPLFGSIHQIIRKYMKIDEIVENILNGLGLLERVYMAGDLAKGIEGDIIDLILIGDINRDYLLVTIEKAEKIIGKRIRYLTYSIEEANGMVFDNREYLLIYGEA